MGRTNIVLDEKLIQKTIRLSGAKSKKEAVNLALKRFVDNADLYRSLKKLKGKLDWRGDLQAMRKDRF